jgi:adenosylcobyric acid synthase
VLPGSKSTVADLRWLRATGLARAVTGLARSGGPTTVLGICGGYQMLGAAIDDAGVETPGPVTVEGLGLLGARTGFRPDKVTRLRRGRALGQPVDGYQIHHGRTVGRDPWVTLDEPDATAGQAAEGDRAGDGAVVGTSLHGLFESDRFREAFLAGVAGRAGRPWTPGGVRFAARRQARIDRLADALEAHLDLAAVDRLIADGVPTGGPIPGELISDAPKGPRP